MSPELTARFQTFHLEMPEHRAVLERMRAELRRWQLATRDTGFLTEPQMWTRIGSKNTPWAIAHDDARYPLARLLDAANGEFL